MTISEKDLKALDECDEYSLRHYGGEVQDLIESYRELQGVKAELLEALEGLIALMYRGGELPEPTMGESAIQTLCRAAIAKAKGEQE